MSLEPTTEVHSFLVWFATVEYTHFLNWAICDVTKGTAIPIAVITTGRDRLIGAAMV